MDVETLLKNKDIYFIPKGSDFLVRCLNPEHEDKNPSMRIDQITGIYQCFSCGFKGIIYKLFGERANQLQLRRALFKKKPTEKRAESVGLSFPPHALPYVGNSRITEFINTLMKRRGWYAKVLKKGEIVKGDQVTKG